MCPTCFIQPFIHPCFYPQIWTLLQRLAHYMICILSNNNPNRKLRWLLESSIRFPLISMECGIKYLHRMLIYWRTCPSYEDILWLNPFHLSFPLGISTLFASQPPQFHQRFLFHMIFFWCSFVGICRDLCVLIRDSRKMLTSFTRTF